MPTGWSHFAQFTIAVVNKDPKKSKYSGEGRSHAKSSTPSMLKDSKVPHMSLCKFECLLPNSCSCDLTFITSLPVAPKPAISLDLQIFLPVKDLGADEG